MHTSFGKVSTIIRILSAIVLVLFAGFWALIALFSDFPSNWSYSIWIIYVVSGHLLAGFLIGTLLPLRWRLALAAAWGSILMGIIGLLGILRELEVRTAVQAPILARLGLAALTLLVIPSVVGLGGYAGSRFATRLRRSDTEPPRLDGVTMSTR